VSNPHGQSTYQVRFDWGAPGADAISEGAHVIVWVDQLGEATLVASSIDLMRATLEEAEEVAAVALRRQTELGGRFVVAVVAAGAVRDDGSLRFAVEDLLAAGAVIDALAAVGIDHQSPEAAAAAAAYLGLKNATRHLISASASSRELRESSGA
jgi:phosphosulfolactate phosphohydrolase-like enzyme